MCNLFEPLFSCAPVQIKDGIFLFGSERDGDFFDESDVAEWRGGRLHGSWHSDALLQNPASRRLIEDIVARAEPVIDLACGPGMGLIPAVKRLAPELPCLASDANPLVLAEWQQYLRRHEQVKNLDLAQFSMMRMPLRDGVVPAYSSFIGLSSTRNGEAGYAQALAEMHRTLRSGGRVYAIENAWTDVPAILRLFERAGMAPWEVFRQEQRGWRERFRAAGFRIVQEELYLRRNLLSDDNELGEAAARFGVEIGMDFTAYILEKA